MPERYRNPSGVDVGSKGLARWVFNRVRHRLPRPPRAPITGVTPDVAFLRANTTETTVTWLGHAAVLLQVGGVNILTDQMLTDWASPFAYFGPRRHQPVPIQPRDLPHVHVVLLSHAHYDHLDAPSVRAIARQAG
ncbi:MAG: MBL fold metallo-hydrolase, partial [Gemmatimonadetes bacterium]|nr:MBL fold metallo-hydrolase [Gemmatimonadota bacterium]